MQISCMTNASHSPVKRTIITVNPQKGGRKINSVLQYNMKTWEMKNDKVSTTNEQTTSIGPHEL